MLARSIHMVIAGAVSRAGYAAALSAPIGTGRDALTDEERRLIDEAVAAGRVRVIPRGVGSGDHGEPGAFLMTRKAQVVLAKKARARAEKARGIARLKAQVR